MLEEIKKLTKDDFKISEDGIDCKVTKATFNPFTGGYNLEWDKPKK